MSAEASGIAALAGGSLDHIGIAAPDLEAALAMHRDLLGFRLTERRVVPEAGLTVAFLQPPGEGPAVELITSHPGASPLTDLLGPHTIQDFLRANPGGGLHHLCVRTRSLATSRAAFAAVGIHPLGDGRGAIGASGRPILFMSPAPPLGWLLELKEVG